MDARILVVDDQPSMCWILTKILSRNGFEVMTAGTGSAALEMLQTHEVHVAIIDYRLPDMDGLELFRRMRRKRLEIPAVLITSYGSGELKESALGAGMLAYFDKPLDMERLLAQLTRALRRETD